MSLQFDDELKDLTNKDDNIQKEFQEKLMKDVAEMDNDFSLEEPEEEQEMELNVEEEVEEKEVESKEDEIEQEVEVTTEKVDEPPVVKDEFYVALEEDTNLLSDPLIQQDLDLDNELVKEDASIEEEKIDDIENSMEMRR